MSIFLRILKSSTYKALFDKTLTIDRTSRSINDQDSVALGPLLAPYRNNYNGTKTKPRHRYGRQIINADGEETTSIIRIDKLKYNTQIKDDKDIIIITHKTTNQKTKKSIP